MCYFAAIFIAHILLKPLSIVIITYNRPADVLFLLHNITQQKNATELLDKVVVIDNASTADYTPVTEYIASQKLPINYVFSTKNLGVARGRNKGIAMVSSPIIITIDDDAYFKDNDALQKIELLFSSDYAQQNNIGVYCFKVFYGSTGALQQTAFPHKKFEAYKDKERFLSYYYIGCGHAIRKEVYDKAGQYPTDFFYGMEEYDLGYRILDLGYKIAYDNSVVIIHNESPVGRTPHAEKMQMLWVNKSKVAYRYLPKIYFYTTAIMWSFAFLKKTSCNMKMFFNGWKKIRKIPSTERKPISEKTLDYIKSVAGRMWY